MDLPMVIGPVDGEKQIMDVIPSLNEIVKGGLITVEDIEVVRDLK